MVGYWADMAGDRFGLGELRLCRLGTRLVHKRNAQLVLSLPVVVGKVYEHHIGKVLHSAANL